MVRAAAVAHEDGPQRRVTPDLRFLAEESASGRLEVEWTRAAESYAVAKALAMFSRARSTSLLDVARFMRICPAPPVP